MAVYRHQNNIFYVSRSRKSYNPINLHSFPWFLCNYWHRLQRTQPRSMLLTILTSKNCFATISFITSHHTFIKIQFRVNCSEKYPHSIEVWHWEIAFATIFLRGTSDTTHPYLCGVISLPPLWILILLCPPTAQTLHPNYAYTMEAPRIYLFLSLQWQHGPTHHHTLHLNSLVKIPLSLGAATTHQQLGACTHYRFPRLTHTLSTYTNIAHIILSNLYVWAAPW